MKLSFDREHAPTSVGMVLAIVMLVGAVVLLELPKPDSTNDVKKIKKATLTSQINTKTANEQIKSLRAQVATQIWSGAGETIGQTALDLVAKLAAKHSLELVSFVPKRSVNAGDLTQIGYLINVSGTYPDLVNFEGELEKPETRLAVENFQLGSTDEATDKVTGTIGVEAYVLTPVPASTTTKTTTTTTSPAKPAPKLTKGGKDVKV